VDAARFLDIDVQFVEETQEKDDSKEKKTVAWKLSEDACGGGSSIAGKAKDGREYVWMI